MTVAIDWDWQAQLQTCQSKIAELEVKIASQKQKIQRLLDHNMNATFAQRILAMREESLERVQSLRRLIETRITDRATDQLIAPPVGAENQRSTDQMRVTNFGNSR